MLTISLTDKQQEELQGLKWQDGAIWERAQYILLLSVGGEVTEIAKLFNRRENSVRKWAGRYIKYGIEGLKSDIPLTKDAAIERESVLNELSKLLGGDIFK
jgi:transposase